MAAIFQIRRGTTNETLVDGELYLHKGSGSIQFGSGSTAYNLLPLNAPAYGDINLTGNLTASNAYFSGDVAISGNLYLGNQTTDTITATGEFTSNLIPNPTNTYTLGSSTKIWKEVHATSISGAIAATNGVISGSAQIPSLLPAGVVSGSSQLPIGIVSGAAQVIPLLPAGVVSGSSQLPIGIVSGSSQIIYANISSIPSNIVSGSSQITYANISSIPAGIVSGAAQVTPLLPAGVVSGSSQVNADSITNFDTNVKDKLNTDLIVSGSTSDVKTFLSLQNVTNESKATMFTSADLTGTPTAPTAVANTNSTQIATTAYVQTELTDLIGGANAAFDTLLEISASLASGDSTLNTLVDGKLSKASNLSDLTNTGTARTNLGVAIGSDVQAYNATLATVAGGTYSGDDSITTIGTVTAGNVTAILPTSVVSGSSQIIYANISSIPPGIVSGSSQITYVDISSIPAGIVSGSSQLTSSLDLRYLVTGSVTSSINELTSITASTTASIVQLFSSASNHKGRIDDLEAASSSFSSSILNLNTTTTTLNTSVSNINTFSGSVLTRLIEIGVVSGSLISSASAASISITNLNSYTSSVSASVRNLNIFSSSYYVDSASFDYRIGILDPGNIDSVILSLQATTASLNTHSGSVLTRLTEIGVVSGSLIASASTAKSSNDSQDVSISNLNSYTSSLKTAITASGTDVTINGNLTVKGTTTQIDSTTLNIGDNIIELNYGGSQTLAGIYTKDATGTLTSGSLLWNSSIDRWIAGASGSESIILLASDGVISSSLQLTNLNNFTSSTTTRLGLIETSTGSLNNFTSSTTTRLGLIETSTGSLNSFTSSINTTIKSKLDADGVISGSSQIITANSITLGTHTTGNYVATIAGTSNQIVVAGSGLESAAITLSTPQNIDTAATPQFGSLGIGTAASGVIGEIRATADIVAFYSSDERLKENIQPIQNALTKVEAISGNTYDWKEGFETIHSHKGNDIGVIAQEVEKILPQAVIDRDNGYKAVDYEKIIPVLIEAIKELSAKIKELENK